MNSSGLSLSLAASASFGALAGFGLRRSGTNPLVVNEGSNPGVWKAAPPPGRNRRKILRPNRPSAIKIPTAAPVSIGHQDMPLPSSSARRISPPFADIAESSPRLTAAVLGTNGFAVSTASVVFGAAAGLASVSVAAGVVAESATSGTSATASAAGSATASSTTSGATSATASGVSVTDASARASKSLSAATGAASLGSAFGSASSWRVLACSDRKGMVSNEPALRRSTSLA